MLLQIISLLVLMITAALCAPGGERQNTRQAPDDKPQEGPQSSGTLDPIGGGNLVWFVNDRNLQEQLFQSLEKGEIKREGVRQNMMKLARDDKPEKPSQSSGTLDPIGGGNLLRLVDPHRKEQVFRSLDIGEREHDGMRQNMMRLAREDKSKPQQHPRPSYTLDSIGGGNLNGLLDLDPYTNELFLSLELNQLLNSLDSYQKEEVLRMLDDTERMVLKTETKHPERMLDSVSGWAFGESKRNFDEIDHGGFSDLEIQVPPPSSTKGNEVWRRSSMERIGQGSRLATRGTSMMRSTEQNLAKTK